MSKTITRLFDTYAEAAEAVQDLERNGVDADRISLVSNNAETLGDGRSAGSALGDRNGDGENDVKEGAGKGAATGGLLGGGAGLLAGLGMLAIPGLGPVVAAGWLASTAVGAAIGAAAGGTAGGLLGALKEAGHSDDEANVYAEGVRRGGALVSVKAHDKDALQVQQILDGRRGVDAVQRGEVYRRSGWAQFDADAPPYTLDQISRERALYQREPRSFAGGERDQSRGDDLGSAEPRPTPGGVTREL